MGSFADEAEENFDDIAENMIDFEIFRGGLWLNCKHITVLLNEAVVVWILARYELTLISVDPWVWGWRSHKVCGSDEVSYQGMGNCIHLTKI